MGCNINEHLQNISQKSIQIQNLSSILGAVLLIKYIYQYHNIKQYYTIKSCDSVILIGIAFIL